MLDWFSFVAGLFWETEYAYRRHVDSLASLSSLFL